MSVLQEQDKILNQYILEEETKGNIFEWIRDFKDFEIRKQLQTEIDTAKKDVQDRDQKIVKLKLKLEEMVIYVDPDRLQ